MKKIILLIIEKIRKALKVDENGNSFGWGVGILWLAALTIMGCEYKTDAEIEKAGRLNGFNIIIVDSCEYIRGLRKLAHKGNCRFCKERRQKELEELIIKLKEK